MAIFPFTLLLLDAYGRTTKRSGQISAATFADAETALAALVVDYQSVTMLHLAESRLHSIHVHEGTPTANANRDEGATFSVWLESNGSNKKASIQIPGPILAARNVDGTIDLTDANIVAWMANYTGGDVLVSDGEEVATFIKGTLDK